MMLGPDLQLPGDMLQATAAQWHARVTKDLAGADFERRLVTRLYESIALQPLYTRADSPTNPPAVPGLTRGWDVRTVHAHPDPDVCAGRIREDVAGGASSILLWCDAAVRIPERTRPRGDGILAWTRDHFARALAEVDTRALRIALQAGACAPGTGRALLDCLSEQRVRGVELNLDPLGALARDGSLATTIDDAWDQLGVAARELTPAWQNLRVAGIDAAPYHHAGASEDQDLGWALATGLAYLRALVDRGMDPDAAANQLVFNLRIGTDFLLAIAKLRAARLLWARIMEVVGASAAMRLVVRTSDRVLTARDPWVNILRGTVTCFAAAVGGADAFATAPFDQLIGPSDQLARRIARNTQLVLSAESHLGAVDDPAAGSYLLESLTGQLADKAWTRLQEVERQGGMARALMDGTIRRGIDETWARREANIAKRKDPIVGVSSFPKLAEKPLHRPAPDLDEILARLGDPVTRSLAATTGEPMPYRRAAAGFEGLRDASDAWLDSHGRRPGVFVCNLGSVAEHTARSNWAQNVFEAGGIEAVGAQAATSSPADAASAFVASEAELAVICGTDAAYEAAVPALAPALKAAGARRVFIAGRPGEAADAWRRAGVDGFIHLGCDILGTLRDIQGDLGVMA